MSVVRGGFLGGFSGKVAGAVGARWKDKQYIRAYVIPANPNTPAQQAQRLLFKYCALFAQGILGAILQSYMDIFLRGMSAWNWFIKQNVSYFGSPVMYSSIQVTHGTLFPATVTGPSNTGGTVIIPFDTAIGSNGMLSDFVYAAVYNEATQRFSLAGAEVTRSSGAISVVTDGTAGNVMHVYLVTCRRDMANVVVKVSDSDYATVTMI
jgi:hypothetical protein